MKFDRERSDFLNASGWRVLRIPNADVYLALGEVEGIILAALTS